MSILAQSNTPFTINIADALQFGFGGSRYILLDMHSGTLQTSNAMLILTDSYGRLTFTPSSVSTFDVSSPSSTEYEFQHSGVTVQTIGEDEYRVTVSTGTPALLYWRIAASSVLPLPSLSVQSIWQYLYEGDFVGFFNALLITTFNSLSIGIALVTMLFLVPLYIRTKSLMLLVVAWLLIGSFLIATMPEVSGLAIVFMALGIGGLFWRLFRPSGG